MTDFARTLVTHEWLAPHGGSENVFEELYAALPGARRHCLWNDAPDRFGAEVPETWLARTPLRRSKAASLAFHDAAWGRVPLDGVDRVVASSHAFGHHLPYRAAESGRAAFAYVHTPARYVWNPELDERGQNPVARAAARWFRRRDRGRTSDAVSYAANSDYVRARIRAAWDVDAVTLHPPVAVRRIQSEADWATRVGADEESVVRGLPDAFVLGASRLIEYKRLDLTIRTGEALGLPVVVAGGGPLEQELRRAGAAASVPVQVLGRVSDAMLYTLYQRASLFAFLAVEDFGIMPVEAMAVGTPVLANAVGGAAESVTLLAGGATVAADAPAPALREAAERALAVDTAGLGQRALQLDAAAFRSRVRDWVAS